MHRAPSDRCGDVSVRDSCGLLGLVEDKTDGAGGRATSNVVYSSRQSRNWAHGASYGLMVHHCTLRSIFGLGNADGGAVSRQEGAEWGVVVKECALAPQPNVPFPKGGGAFLLLSFGRWCRVFPDPE